MPVTDTIPLPNGASIYRLESELDRKDYVRLVFPRTGGRSAGSCTLTMADACSPAKIKAGVLNGGGHWPLIGPDGQTLTDPMSNLPEVAGILAATSGWKGEGAARWFCLPSGNLGNLPQVAFLDDKLTALCLASGAKGDLDLWMRTVANPAQYSPTASLVILCALASALLPYSKLREGFILNIAGDGSAGKTTANIAAASVWGHRASMGDWNGSITALTDLAGANTHVGVILDDAEKAAPRPEDRIQVLQDLTHLLTSGKSKSYSKTLNGKDQLATHRFETLVLSSSPFSVESFMAEKGQDRTDGDRARLLELVIPKKDQRGIWIPLEPGDDAGNTAAKSAALNDATKEAYGTAGPAFVSFLCENLEVLEPLVEKFRQKFVKRCRQGLSNVDGRIADKVALLYAAGRLCIKAEILPWTKAHLLSVTVWGLEQILSASRATVFDIEAAGRLVATCLADGERYSKVHNPKVSDCAWPKGKSGFLHAASGCAYVSREAFFADIERLSGMVMTPSQQASFLKKLVVGGILKQGEGGASTKTTRLENGKRKLLIFDLTVVHKPKGRGSR